MMGFNEIFGKNVTYNDIKSRKKAEFHPLIRNYVLEKTTRRTTGLSQKLFVLIKGKEYQYDSVCYETHMEISLYFFSDMSLNILYLMPIKCNYCEILRQFITALPVINI